RSWREGASPLAGPRSDGRSSQSSRLPLPSWERPPLPKVHHPAEAVEPGFRPSHVGAGGHWKPDRSAPPNAGAAPRARRGEDRWAVRGGGPESHAVRGTREPRGPSSGGTDHRVGHSNRVKIYRHGNPFTAAVQSRTDVGIAPEIFCDFPD